MKTYHSILTILVILLVSYTSVNAQNTSTKSFTIVDGHFFQETPVSRHKIINHYFLKTSNGKIIIGQELSEPLSPKALQHAIPVEQVPEGKILLQKYNLEKAKRKDVKVMNPLPLKEGEQFPQFTATDIEGKTWSNADVKGKIMVLNLWYTGCGPCRTEMPELSKWKDEMPDVMFFSATFEDATKARPVLKSKGFNWIHLVKDNQFSKFIGSYGYPMTIIINQKGIVSQIEYGTSSVQRAELKAMIQSLR